MRARERGPIREAHFLSNKTAVCLTQINLEGSIFAAECKIDWRLYASFVQGHTQHLRLLRGCPRRQKHQVYLSHFDCAGAVSCERTNTGSQSTREYLLWTSCTLHPLNCCLVDYNPSEPFTHQICMNVLKKKLIFKNTKHLYIYIYERLKNMNL